MRRSVDLREETAAGGPLEHKALEPVRTSVGQVQRIVFLVLGVEYGHGLRIPFRGRALKSAEAAHDRQRPIVGNRTRPHPEHVRRDPDFGHSGGLGHGQRHGGIKPVTARPVTRGTGTHMEDARTTALPEPDRIRVADGCRRSRGTLLGAVSRHRYPDSQQTALQERELEVVIHLRTVSKGLVGPRDDPICVIGRPRHLGGRRVGNPGGTAKFKDVVRLGRAVGETQQDLVIDNLRLGGRRHMRLRRVAVDTDVDPLSVRRGLTVIGAVITGVDGRRGAGRHMQVEREDFREGLGIRSQRQLRDRAEDGIGNQRRKIGVCRHEQGIAGQDMPSRAIQRAAAVAEYVGVRRRVVLVKRREQAIAEIYFRRVPTEPQVASSRRVLRHETVAVENAVPDLDQAVDHVQTRRPLRRIANVIGERAVHDLRGGFLCRVIDHQGAATR